MSGSDRRARSLLAFGTLLAALTVGCGGGASWKERWGALPHPPPSRVIVRVHGEVEHEDGDAPADVLARALEDELNENGVSSYVTVSPQRPPPLPRFDVHVVDWIPGEMLSAGMVLGILRVSVSHLRADGHQAFAGRLEGYVVGGSPSGDASDAAEAAGREIAKAIVNGRPSDPERRQR